MFLPFIIPSLMNIGAVVGGLHAGEASALRSPCAYCGRLFEGKACCEGCGAPFRRTGAKA